MCLLNNKVCCVSTLKRYAAEDNVVNFIKIEKKSSGPSPATLILALSLSRAIISVL